jgi:ribosomal protein S18 acetylase RimI-like enzyme
MKKQLENKKNIFLIAKKNSEAFGIIRYNLNSVIAYISINIAKKFRNLGYGSIALKKSEKFLKESLIIIAEVKKGNKGSLIFFKKNKYVILSKKKHFTLTKIVKR